MTGFLFFGSPSVTHFITFSNWRANANQLKINNFLKEGRSRQEKRILRRFPVYQETAPR